MEEEDFKEVYNRIATLERRQNWFVGVGATIVFCVGVAATFIMRMFTGVG
jgi:hypothetical protein